jgi:hypothetical protein
MSQENQEAINAGGVAAIIKGEENASDAYVVEIGRLRPGEYRELMGI